MLIWLFKNLRLQRLRFISADGLVGETGNLLTQNMYAYAGNNPVMNVDPFGYFWNDIFEFVKNIGEGIVEYIDDITPNTISVGVTATAYLPVFTAFGFGGCIGGGISAQLSLDKKGNLGFQYSVIGGVGSPSLGIAVYKTTTNAPTIYDLNGLGTAVDGSIGEGYFYGAELNQYYSDRIYTGSTTMYGYGVRLPVPGEIHVSGSIKSTPWSVNLIDLFNDIF